MQVRKYNEIFEKYIVFTILGRYNIAI